MQGEAKGTLNCHVDSIKIHQQVKGTAIKQNHQRKKWQQLTCHSDFVKAKKADNLQGCQLGISVFK